MRSFRSKPVGWRGESYRHSLAARGYRAVKWNLKRVAKVGGHVEYMSPDEYLEMIGDDVNDPKHKKIFDKIYDSDAERRVPIAEFAERMKKGEVEVVPPEWHKNQYGTYVQEGRHRALAAKAAGEESIPVVVAQPKEQQSEDVREEFIEAIGATGGYDAEWRRRFDSGSPGMYMDPGSLKVYANILKKKGIKYPEEWDEGDVPEWIEKRAEKKKDIIYGDM